MFWQSLSMDYYSEYGPGPGLLPLWVSGLIILLTLMYLGVTLKKEILLFKDVLPKGEGAVNVLVCMGSLVLFMIIVPFTGFVIGSTVTLFILFTRGYKWYWGLGFSVVVSLVVFLVFGMALQVPLPVNDFGW